MLSHFFTFYSWLCRRNHRVAWYAPGSPFPSGRVKLTPWSIPDKQDIGPWFGGGGEDLFEPLQPLEQSLHS